MESDLALRDLVGVQDAILLEDFRSEEVFIDNLEKRFKETLIYTYIGPVLISLNPYKELPIYNSETIEKYRNVNFFEVPPHVYAVADTALRAMRGEYTNQCILISGESGSGKTEASKKVLQFIAATCRNKKVVEVVKEKLLQSNPVLEAFGNAKTNRNNNSSRFGKYMDTEFSTLGDPVGGHILNYLLEKSRVVYQGKGERNFHIFYQLLAGADDALLAKLHLKRDPANYFYLNQGNSSTVKNINDAADFKAVNAAMKVMDLSEKEIDAIMKIVATIIHLGNVHFEDSNGRARVKTKDVVEIIAKLLDTKAESIENALTNKTIEARGDVVTSPLSNEESVYARDAWAKAIYGRLFDWLVKKLNESLASEDQKKTVVVGILDIYGFEIFQKNSFEQFCINYCNEKLQQLFIELTLKSEQEEYLREGIEWEPVEFFDNKIIVDLVEEKHKGIIAHLDEECLRPGSSTDATFLAKLNKQLAAHPHFVSHQNSDSKGRKTIDRDEFRLVHYAGEVTYNVKGFMDKNNDLLFRDLKEAMSNANNMIAKETFPKSELTNKKRPDTAASQFRTSLNQLAEILKSKEPSYIRCIKPNEDQLASRFARDIVSHQVKYLGLMENLRVRRAGFAYRRPYEGFLNRYKSLCPETWPHPKVSPRDAVQLLANHLKYGKEDYRMGKTKIFIRLPRTLFETEDAFQRRKEELVAKIQAVWKGRQQRKKYLHMRACAIKVQAGIRRFIAVRRAKKRKWAVIVVRNFIRGFMNRNSDPCEANLKFLQFVRHHYLLRLANQLPKSVLQKEEWPQKPPRCCEESSNILRKLHLRWMVRHYCRTLSPERKRMIELKILAEKLFQGKKKGYEQTVTVWFKSSRLSAEQDTVFKSGFEVGAKSASEKTIYVCPVTKYDRHGYKPRERLLVITSSALYLLDAKNGKVKHRLSFKQLVAIRITKMKDGLMLVNIPEELKKEKGDLILSCDHVFEALTFLVDVAKNPDLVAIEDASSITHRMVDGKEGVIDLTTNGGTTGITKGKNGHLIVVSQ